MLSNALRNPRSPTTVLAAMLCLALPAGARSNTAAAPGFSLTSSDLMRGGMIDAQHVYNGGTCRGGNVSPALAWTAPPAGTRSFALLMFDPDAPGGGWWHWMVFDIPAATRALPAGAGNPAAHLMPAGAIQGRNDFGSLGYGGPCPPPGPPHRYRLMLYALKVARLKLSSSVGPGDLASKVRAQSIAKAEMTVLYGR